jgi:hypothetical protein
VSGPVLVVMTEPGSANAAGPVALELARRGVALDVYAEPTAEAALRVWGLEPAPAEYLPPGTASRWACGLLGSSAAPCPEWAAVESLHRAGRPVLTVIDAATSLGQRFIDPSRLPDALALPDATARGAALTAGLPAERLHVTGNPYLEHVSGLPVPVQRAEARQRMDVRPDSLAVLFALEPAAGPDDQGEGPDEASMLDALSLACDGMSSIGGDAVLVLRPHPRQHAGEVARWQGALAASHPTVRVLVSAATDGRSAAGACDLVLGVASNLLVEAAALGVPSAALGHGPWQGACAAVRMGLSPHLTDQHALALLLSARGQTGGLQGTVGTAMQVHQGATGRVLSLLERLL